MDKDKERFEKLKSQLDELRLKKLSDEKEIARCEQKLNELRGQIKRTYNVEPEDLDGMLLKIRKDIDEKTRLLEKRVAEAEELLK